jgi:hypothetical protein
MPSAVHASALQFTAPLSRQAIGGRFHAILVDSGTLRGGEAAEVGGGGRTRVYTDRSTGQLPAKALLGQPCGISPR